MRVARLLLLIASGALIGYGCIGTALLYVMQRGPSGDDGFDGPYYIHGAWIGALIGYVVHRCWPSSVRHADRPRDKD